MTRGIRPVAGIAEAKRMATVWGFALIEIGMEARMPFDFGIHSNGSTSLVRVRRLKNHGYREELICRSCAGADQGIPGTGPPGRDWTGTLGAGTGTGMAPVPGFAGNS